MTDPTAAQRVRDRLAAQIEKLGELRNASTRDANFKLWRQTTLTLIQRVWEGDDVPSTRFRRIPFTPPSTRADERATREWYERGCAEAAQLLKALLTQIEEDGLPEAAGRARDDRSDSEEVGDTYPTLTLPETGASAASAPAAPLGIPALPRPVPEGAIPPVGEGATSEASWEGRRIPDAAPARGAAGRPARSAPSAGRPGSRTGKNGRRGGSKPRLKDLLGFGDEPAPGAAHAAGVSPVTSEPHTPPAGSRPAPPMLPFAAPPEFQPPPEDAAETPGTAPATGTTQPAGPRASDEETNEIALQSALDAALGSTMEEEAERATDEFLRSSPVFRARPKPVVHRVDRAPRPVQSPAARAVVAVAADVGPHSVPAGHCAQVRAALLDLAHQLDHRDLTWDALREAVTFVMEYPAIGKRVLPLLIAYLDEAA